MCSFLITDKWYNERKKDVANDNKRIVKAVAKLVVSQTREMEIDKVNYPFNDAITVDNNYIPPLLKLFMKFLVLSNLKQNSIGQCLVQAARPWSIATPIPLALGVDVDHYVGSRNLIVELSRLGFSVSYDEVIRYKQSYIGFLKSCFWCRLSFWFYTMGS